MHCLALTALLAAVLSGCALDGRYDTDSRPADTSARTPLQPTKLERLEYGSDTGRPWYRPPPPSR